MRQLEDLASAAQVPQVCHSSVHHVMRVCRVLTPACALRTLHLLLHCQCPLAIGTSSSPYLVGALMRVMGRQPMKHLTAISCMGELLRALG